jgi:hypothetical protein
MLSLIITFSHVIKLHSDLNGGSLYFTYNVQYVIKRR